MLPIRKRYCALVFFTFFKTLWWGMDISWPHFGKGCSFITILIAFKFAWRNSQGHYKQNEGLSSMMLQSFVGIIMLWMHCVNHEHQMKTFFRIFLELYKIKHLCHQSFTFLHNWLTLKDLPH
jgi:hypothetical protein